MRLALRIAELLHIGLSEAEFVGTPLRLDSIGNLSPFNDAHHTPPSASRQIPSGPMDEGNCDQIRRLLRDPSSATSKAVRRWPIVSPTKSVQLSGVMTRPLGLLALRRLLPCVQGMLWRVAIRHIAKAARHWGVHRELTSGLLATGAPKRFGRAWRSD
jgi:hypothetical protein